MKQGWKNIFQAWLMAMIAMFAYVEYSKPVYAASAGWTSKSLQYTLLRKIPKRSPHAMSGTMFITKVEKMSRTERDGFIYRQLMSGNMPSHLRLIKPVRARVGQAGGGKKWVTFFVLPDYLAVGSDSDFVRIPMSAPLARRVAHDLGFILPTTKMVDLIYAQADIRLKPRPLPAGPQMTSFHTIMRHQKLVSNQLASYTTYRGKLIAGHKKDIVLSQRLMRSPRRVAIYGWHRGRGLPIQPLSTVHDADYIDYSHGVRLVSHYVLINGKLSSIYDWLQKPLYADTFTDEGVLPAALVEAVDEIRDIPSDESLQGVTEDPVANLIDDEDFVTL
jgi:hypothetical protein